VQIPELLQGVINAIRSLPRKAYFIAVPVPIFLVTVAVSLATSGGDDAPEVAFNPTVVTPSSQNIDAPATATPTVTKVPSTPTPEPTTPPANREDCDEIQGTAYESPEEREWYLANCLNGQTATSDNTGGGGSPPSTGAPSGGGAVYAGEFALGDTLVIPSLGINATVTGATVPSSGAMPDPAGYFNAVWYDFSNFPGLGGYTDGNLVLAAHVDCAACHNGSSGLALFYYIGSLVPGAQAQYYSHTGEVATYVVRSVNVYSPGTNWSSIVATSTADMTLITCGGTWDPVAHEYSTRTAVWLDRVS
jgi:hypothetical protein